MRVVKELSKDDVKISVFVWNNKYLLKFEQGMIEQTFKIHETDFSEEAGLDAFWSGDFFEGVKKRFEEMHAILRKQLENT